MTQGVKVTKPDGLSLTPRNLHSRKRTGSYRLPCDLYTDTHRHTHTTKTIKVVIYFNSYHLVKL